MDGHYMKGVNVLGLTVRIKGYEGAYDCGYITYGVFLMNLVDTMYGKFYGDIFSAWYREKNPSADDLEMFNRKVPEDIRIWLRHSDCDGKFTPKECRAIYESIKDVYMDMEGHNYGDMKPYNMLERWKDMFLYCAKHRVNMYFM